ncbi:MAG: membrane or secreted protein [Bacteroidota bacterium]|nr:membrane or secreted protein [Bacteroidota bacterium]
MRYCIKIFALIFFNISLGQGIVGAWERYENTESVKQKQVVIFSEKFQAISIYDADTGKFIYSNGGTWKLNGNTMTEKVEFDTGNPERVGSKVSFEIKLNNNTLEVIDSGNKWKRIDDGTPGDLNGAWLMSGRYRNGVKQTRRTDGPRKTMKLLSGTRFQWIAYNTETKQFMGTGGGTYSTVDGVYKENIEFFSRDDSKSGLKLEFNYEIIDGDWNHKGLNSKGDPLHEIWSKRVK